VSVQVREERPLGQEGLLAHDLYIVRICRSINHATVDGSEGVRVGLTPNHSAMPEQFNIWEHLKHI